MCRDKVGYSYAKWASNTAKNLITYSSPFGLFVYSSFLKDVKKVILKELHLLGQRDGLKSFEQVKDIYIHDELFSIENGLLTPTLKSKVRSGYYAQISTY